MAGSDAVFNHSHKELTDLETKELGFSLTPTFINKADIRRDFADFDRKIRCKCFFHNKPTADFTEIAAFRQSIIGETLEIFSSQMEKEIFSLRPGNSTLYNLTKEK